MKCDALTSTLKQQRAVGRLASANELLNLRRGPRICHLTLKSKSISPQMNGLFSRSCQRSGGFRVGSEDVSQANVLLVGRQSGGLTESLVLVRATLDFSEQRVPSRVAPFHLQPCRVLGKRAALACLSQDSTNHRGRGATVCWPCLCPTASQGEQGSEA